MDGKRVGLLRTASRFLVVACVALIVAVSAGGCGSGGSYTFHSNEIAPQGTGSGSVQVNITVTQAAAAEVAQAKTRAASDLSVRVHIQQSGTDVVTPQTVPVPGFGVPVQLAFANVPPGPSVLLIELLDPQGTVLGAQETAFTVRPQTSLTLDVQFVVPALVVTPNPAYAEAAQAQQPDAKAVNPQIGNLGTQVTFSVSGGVAPYTWSLSTNNSGGTLTAAGVYTAGSVGNVDDFVTATDSLGNTGVARVHVYPPLLLDPHGDFGAGGQPVPFTISAGSGTGYTITVDQNQSGGTLTYVPGATTGTWTPGIQGGIDIISAHDSLGGLDTLRMFNEF